MEKLKNIFDIQYGNQFDFSKMDVSENDNGTNFISRSSQNNGFVAKVERYKDVEPFEAGLITVTMGGSYLLASFVQSAPFYTAQNIKVLRPKKNLTIEEKLFYCSAIEHNRFRYHSHSREANTTFDDIFVPSLDELPKYVQKKQNYDMFLQKPFLDKKPEINVNNWKWFKIADIFLLEKCKCSNATELLEEGNDIAYIGAKKKENGFMKNVLLVPTLVTKGNCIIFIGDGQGSVGYCTYQPIDFIGSTTLTAGYSLFLNQYNALFLVAILDMERYRYSFGRKYGYKVVKETKIKLPAKNGQPDFEFMENYIKSLPYSKSI